jgi:chorismate synthase
MGSIIGERVRISVFGESHGRSVGVVIDGLPSGIRIDTDAISAHMLRRAPGRALWSSTRREGDTAEIQSGVYRGYTTGTPLCALIQNFNTRSTDYDELRTKPRPSHADYTGSVRYGGFGDPRGGGHFSGRLTAPLVFAGAVCLQALQKHDIFIGAHALEIGGEMDTCFGDQRIDVEFLRHLAGREFPVISDEAGERMKAVVEEARKALDSVGGIVECGIANVPAGLGDPLFGGLESRIGAMVLAIPAVKGIEFGDGFPMARRRGSENNDALVYRDGAVHTATNHNGGIDGGISNGMPIVFRAVVKPTASIALAQQTIDLETKTPETLVIKGRHDPCIVPRAVPVVEAAAAIALLDVLVSSAKY